MVSNILDAFEDSFERLVEGSVGRIFRSQIQPAEIGRKLERAMLTKQVVSVESTLVPNDYRVGLNPADMAAFADFTPALCRQMETWLGEVADRHGFTVIGRMRVSLSGDESVSRRTIRVAATISDQPKAEPTRRPRSQETEVLRVVGETTGPRPVRLVFTGGSMAGTELVLRKRETTIGRATDNDLVVGSSEVSRHHARLELGDDGLRVVDLGSTNGTLVNGRRIAAQRVVPEDEITFGSLTAHVAVGDGDDR